MAGETEEPIRHDFQAGRFDSLHSGSISFGRFESEALCWERRSSFSHNRYLEEVEKCSKPGSVTEKKAYFEAHFRKKGILGMSSAESQNEYQTGENGMIEKTGYDEEINHAADVEYVSSTFEAQYDLSCDITDKPEEADHSRHGDFSEAKVKENLDGEEYNSDISHVSNVTVGLFGDSDDSAKGERGSASKEKIQSQSEYTKPKSAPQDSVAQSRRYISNKSSKKSSEGKTNKTVNKTSEASAQDNRQMRKASKNECGFNAKSGSDMKRINSAVGMSRPCLSKDNTRFRLKCNYRAERRKEFDMKFEEKMHAKEVEMHQRLSKTKEKTEAEIKQLRKNLNFKARPLPSFYHASLRDSDRNKATANNVEPRRVRTKSSDTGTMVSESSRISCKAGKDEAVYSSGSPKTTDHLHHLTQASGATSCHSTVTSDSSPSSPSAVNSKGPTSQAVTNGHMDRRKGNDKNKHTSLRNHKGPEVKKSMDGKQKKRTERSIHAAFTNGSRAGHKTFVRA